MIEKTINGIKYCLDEEALTAEVIQKKGYEGDIIIPDVVVFRKISYRVMSIGYAAFCNCSALTAITIPNGVTSIGERAFDDCKSLTNITFQGSIAQWEEIALDENWKNKVPTKVVHCTDGDVEI